MGRIDWQPTLSGPRLLLRPLAEADYAALFSVASDPLIWEQHPDRRRHTPERFQAYFRSGMESRGALVVIDRQSGEMIGSARFREHNPRESFVEIGYTFLARKCWGGGCNGELKRLMLGHAFRFVDTVFFLVAPENFRSRKALLKIGASELEAGASGPVPAGARCSIVYRMTKSEWARRAPTPREPADATQ